jgi:hypothetical protein
MAGRNKSNRNFAEELQGTSPFGRPKRRYGDNIKNGSQRKGIEKYARKICLGSIGLTVWAK